ncbi:hypothetical protein HMPREF2992_01070 [Prevotella sp. HMSC069G02]|nr:hypothetical protein HMPREF2992_01070 [Prevotella sp. HMSC069G02]
MKHLSSLIILFCFAMQGQCINIGKPSLSADNKRWDVWQRLTLKGKLYGKKTYQIRYVRDTNDEFRRGYIHFSSGKTRFATIKLPLADFECKNFCVDSLMQSKRGFILLISWGGGKYLYNMEYIFRYRQGSFFLDKIITRLFQPEEDEEKTTYKRMKKPLKMKGIIALPELLN